MAPNWSKYWLGLGLSPAQSLPLFLLSQHSRAGWSMHVLGGKERLRRAMNRAHSWTRKDTLQRKGKPTTKPAGAYVGYGEFGRPKCRNTAHPISETFKVHETVLVSLTCIWVIPPGQRCHLLQGKWHVEFLWTWERERRGKPRFQHSPSPSLIPVCSEASVSLSSSSCHVGLHTLLGLLSALAPWGYPMGEGEPYAN